MNQRVKLVLAGALGAGIGAVARWWLAVLFADGSARGFPWATLIANGCGSFVIGVVAALATRKGHIMAMPAVRQFVMVGLCGGLTTFSGFSLELLTFIQIDAYALAIAYAAMSVTLWLTTVWCGFALARRFVPREEHQPPG